MTETPSQVAALNDVHVGLEIPSLTRGPLSPMHLMRFSAAIENWHRIHYDRDFATTHDGLPDLVVSGSWKQHFVAQVVRQWIGEAGWLRDIGLQYRRVNVVGETLTAWGQVTRVRPINGFGLVDLDVGIRNQDGEESSPGKATVALPKFAGHRLPRPLPATELV